MNQENQKLADALRQADRALLGSDVPTRLNAAVIQSLQGRKARRQRFQWLAFLMLTGVALASLAFQDQNKNQGKIANGSNSIPANAASVATLASALNDAMSVKTEMKQPAFEPPIELELEREAVAVVFLNRALRFRRAGEYPDEAKAALDFIVNTFPSTISAEHARMLLKSPNVKSIVPGENL